MGKCSLWISSGSEEKRVGLEAFGVPPKKAIWEGHRQRKTVTEITKKQGLRGKCQPEGKSVQGSCGQRVPAGKPLTDLETHT